MAEKRKSRHPIFYDRESADLCQCMCVYLHVDLLKGPSGNRIHASSCSGTGISTAVVVIGIWGVASVLLRCVWCMFGDENQCTHKQLFGSLGNQKTGVMRTCPYLFRTLLLCVSQQHTARLESREEAPICHLVPCYSHRNILLCEVGTKPCSPRTHNAKCSKILRARDTEMVGIMNMPPVPAQGRP